MSFRGQERDDAAQNGPQGPRDQDGGRQLASLFPQDVGVLQGDRRRVPEGGQQFQVLLREGFRL
jgi:hypothetical protein